MTVLGLDLRVTAKKLAREIKEDDVTGLAAELSYRFFLALFPFFLFVAAMGGFIANAAGIENPAERFIEQFGDQMPADAASVIRTQVNEVVEGSNAGLISVSILGAIWAASGGVSALMKAVNRAYDIPESRPFWKKALISIGVTVGGGALALTAVATLVATEIYADDIAAWFGLAEQWQVVVTILRFPLLLAFLAVVVGFVYWVAPNTGLPWHWITPGAILFAFGWTIGSVGFSIYVTNFGSYGATYGALGGVVVLLFWFYISSFVLLAGAELNSVIDEEKCGPALAERRRLVAEQLAKHGIDMPGPENENVRDGLEVAAANAALAQATGDAGAIEDATAELSEPEDEAVPAHEPGRGVWQNVPGFVRQHPVPSAMAALTAGFMIGRMKR